jgi:hypothetical protein
MELLKPNGEECGNCKFCISDKIMMPQMMPLSKPVEETIFQCRRYPSSPFTRKDGWCGEWKLRVVISNDGNDVIHLIH